MLDDDAGHFKEEEDVYDLVDQNEYQNLVESRRQREDFVVDDGTSNEQRVDESFVGCAANPSDKQYECEREHTHTHTHTATERILLCVSVVTSIFLDVLIQFLVPFLFYSFQFHSTRIATPDGIGYYDDGEECLGDEDNFRGTNKKKNKRGTSTAALTARSLKKMRKNKHAQNVASTDVDPDDGAAADDAVSSTRSMWDFVSVGAHATNNHNNGADSGRRSKNSNDFGGSSRATTRNLDEMLGELDDPLAMLPKSRRAPRATYGRQPRPK